jgi:hypothetical protein
MRSYNDCTSWLKDRVVSDTNFFKGFRLEKATTGEGSRFSLYNSHGATVKGLGLITDLTILSLFGSMCQS